MTLKELKTGQTGVVLRLEGTGALRRRLIDMGVTPGTRVQIKTIAPLGDPIKVILRGYELSLRTDDAAKIYICENDKGIS
ncbi:MAG: ferrous iron transport protein A [Clostridiales bacterium]|jgi:ferrous iron transport protein B|nr:ferrous iron transport protein A [Clostridiales bacterium]